MPGSGGVFKHVKSWLTALILLLGGVETALAGPLPRVVSLDPEHQLKVMKILKNLAGQDRAVVIVLHDLTLAARFCDTLRLIDKGRVVASGNAEAVLTPKNLKSVYKITAKRGKNFIVPWQVV